jgi:hypothetical protein
MRRGRFAAFLNGLKWDKYLYGVGDGASAALCYRELAPEVIELHTIGSTSAVPQTMWWPVRGPFGLSTDMTLSLRALSAGSGWPVAG